MRFLLFLAISVGCVLGVQGVGKAVTPELWADVDEGNRLFDEYKQHKGKLMEVAALERAETATLKSLRELLPFCSSGSGSFSGESCTEIRIDDIMECLKDRLFRLILERCLQKDADKQKARRKANEEYDCVTKGFRGADQTSMIPAVSKPVHVVPVGCVISRVSTGHVNTSSQALNVAAPVSKTARTNQAEMFTTTSRASSRRVLTVAGQPTAATSKPMITRSRPGLVAVAGASERRKGHK